MNIRKIIILVFCFSSVCLALAEKESGKTAAKIIDDFPGRKDAPFIESKNTTYVVDTKENNPSVCLKNVQVYFSEHRHPDDMIKPLCVLFSGVRSGENAKRFASLLANPQIEVHFQDKYVTDADNRTFGSIVKSVLAMDKDAAGRKFTLFRIEPKNLWVRSAGGKNYSLQDLGDNNKWNELNERQERNPKSPVEESEKHSS